MHTSFYEYSSFDYEHFFQFAGKETDEVFIYQTKRLFHLLVMKDRQIYQNAMGRDSSFDSRRANEESDEFSELFSDIQLSAIWLMVIAYIDILDEEYCRNLGWILCISLLSGNGVLIHAAMLCYFKKFWSFNNSFYLDHYRQTNRSLNYQLILILNNMAASSIDLPDIALNMIFNFMKSLSEQDYIHPNVYLIRNVSELVTNRYQTMDRLLFKFDIFEMFKSIDLNLIYHHHRFHFSDSHGKFQSVNPLFQSVIFSLDVLFSGFRNSFYSFLSYTSLMRMTWNINQFQRNFFYKSWSNSFLLQDLEGQLFRLVDDGTCLNEFNKYIIPSSNDVLVPSRYSLYSKDLSFWKSMFYNDMLVNSLDQFLQDSRFQMDNVSQFGLLVKSVKWNEKPSQIQDLWQHDIRSGLSLFGGWRIYINFIHTNLATLFCYQPISMFYANYQNEEQVRVQTGDLVFENNAFITQSVNFEQYPEIIDEIVYRMQLVYE